MAGWQDVTSNTYWDADGSGTSWTGTAWYSNMETVSLAPKVWATGYVPTKLKFASADSPASWTLSVDATGSGQFSMGVSPGAEINLTHSGDITQISIIGNLGDGEVTVTKLELYGDAIPSEVSFEASSSAILTFPVVSIWKDGTIAWADGTIVWDFGIEYPKLSVNSRVESLTCSISVLYPRSLPVVLSPEGRSVGLVPAAKAKILGV